MGVLVEGYEGLVSWLGGDRGWRGERGGMVIRVRWVWQKMRGTDVRAGGLCRGVRSVVTLIFRFGPGWKCRMCG
jgi:hypothetical protein